MKEVKKRSISKILGRIGLLALLLLGIAAVITYISREPSNYKKSFDEGTKYGEVYLAVAASDMSLDESYEFTAAQTIFIIEHTVESFKYLEEVAAKILGDDYIELSFRENTDLKAFLAGTATKLMQTAIESAYEEGIISKEAYDIVIKKYDELVKEPSKQKLQEFTDVADKYVGSVLGNQYGLESGVVSSLGYLPPHLYCIGKISFYLDHI